MREGAIQVQAGPQLLSGDRDEPFVIHCVCLISMQMQMPATESAGRPALIHLLILPLPSCSSAPAAFTCIYSISAMHAFKHIQLAPTTSLPSCMQLISPWEVYRAPSPSAACQLECWSWHEERTKLQAARGRVSWMRRRQCMHGVVRELRRRSSGGRLACSCRCRAGSEREGKKNEKDPSGEEANNSQTTRKPPVFPPVATEQNCSSCWGACCIALPCPSLLTNNYICICRCTCDLSLCFSSSIQCLWVPTCRDITA